MDTATACGNILVVDDESLNRVLLATNLKEQGHTVILASSGTEALDIMQADHPDVVLLDILMPGMDGFEVLAQLKAHERWRQVPVIMISAADDADSVVRCIELGAMDHLPKPFSPVILNARLRSALAARRLTEEQEAHRRDVEHHNRELEVRVSEQTREIQGSLHRLNQVLDSTVLALASLVERRDPYTAGHQRRVAVLACKLAAMMGLPEDQIAGIQVAGVLHDVGKVCVPAEILSKPGKITSSEFGAIAVHPTVGYDVLKGIEFRWPVADVVVQHHEKLDGGGYPAGLKDSEILLEARIIEVADIVEAISYHRPYRAALGMEVALAEIIARRGTAHDATVVDACVTLVQEQGFQFET